MPKKLSAAALALFLCLALTTVEAHKVNLFAWAEGKTISGYVYFPGGARAQNVSINWYAPDGTLLGQTTTNDQGEFSFEASSGVDHQLVADLGDGHVAKYTVPAEEIGIPETNESDGMEAAETPEEPATQDDSAGSRTESDAGDVIRASMVEKAVAKQLIPLREQLERYENRVRLHDILGGIGYIFGLAGMGLYLRSRKRAQRGV
jgi:nickel transport protein